MVRLLETEEGRENLRTHLGEACKAYRRALGLDEELAEAHRGLGYALLQLERHEDAAQAFMVYLQARSEARDRTTILKELQAIAGVLRSKEGGREDVVSKAERENP